MIGFWSMSRFIFDKWRFSTPESARVMTVNTFWPFKKTFKKPERNITRTYPNPQKGHVEVSKLNVQVLEGMLVCSRIMSGVLTHMREFVLELL